MDYFNISLIALSILTFYLFFIVPQKKEKMMEKKFFDGLKKGSKIVLKNGLCGKFSHFESDNVVIEVSSGIKLEFLKEVIYVSKSIEMSKDVVKE